MADEMIVGETRAVTPPPPTLPASDSDDKVGEITKEALERQIRRRQAANREAQEAKQKLVASEEKIKALEARIKGYEDQEKTEREKLTQQIQELRTEYEKVRNQITEKDSQLLMESIRTQVVLAGVRSLRSASFVAQQFLEEKQKDQNLEFDIWVEKFRQTSPEFFVESQVKTAAKSASGGPGPTVGKGTEREQRLKEINSEIEELSKPGLHRRSDRTEARLFHLRLEKRRIEAQK